MKKLAFASATAGALAAAAMSSAFAGMSMQGPQLTGVTLQSPASDQPAIVAVMLPSGNTIDLHKAIGRKAAGHR